MSRHTYTRELIDGLWDVGEAALAAGVEAALPGKVFGIWAVDASVAILFADELTTGEIITLDAVVVAQQAAFDPLPVLKARRFAEIEARTDQLIALGFEYPPASGNFYSLDLASQLRTLGVDHSKDFPELTYPVRWSTVNKMEAVDLANAAATRGFFLTALGTLRGRIDSGTVLYDAIRAATTKAEIDAVVDTR
jgi:hypothetical protein